MKIPFNNSYAALGDTFFSRQAPAAVKSPELIRVNARLAAFLGLDAEALASADSVEMLAGNSVPEGAEPIATVYAGHQFGSWNPQLGDGRAILLGEVIAEDGERYDIQLKGAGETAYSRMGDGRSPLGPVLREYIVSEAMSALGVPTTRSLAAVTTGERVFRDEILPGAILTRVAKSHIRVGTFQYFAARGEVEAVKTLADYVIHRHYPGAGEAQNPYSELLNLVIRNQASLIAKWQSLGFIHGVMNTDNMLVSGETVDYGPCAFMDTHHPDTVYSSIDVGGRYAYKNQPSIGKWNLMWLAQSLLPLLDTSESRAIEIAQEALNSYDSLFQSAYEGIMAKKLGFANTTDETRALFSDFTELLTEHRLDHTLSFWSLAELATADQPRLPTPHALYPLPPAMEPWISRWQAALRNNGHPEQAQALIHAVNPIYIPRNHLVEEAISNATYKGDFEPFHKLVDVLSAPFSFDPDNIRYALPPRPEEVVAKTFCGT